LLKGSFSEVEIEDPVVEIIRWESALEGAQRKSFHLIWQDAVGISVDHRDLVLLGVPIQLVVRVIRRRAIP
jgi:hypothetical protein